MQSISRLYGPAGRMTNWWLIIKGSGSAAVAKDCLNIERSSCFVQRKAKTASDACMHGKLTGNAALQ
jgi:hypothetical protein